jgi:hypothetical protein
LIRACKMRMEVIMEDDAFWGWVVRVHFGSF